MTKQDDLNRRTETVPAHKDQRDKADPASTPQPGQDETPADGQTIAEIGDKLGGPA